MVGERKLTILKKSLASGKCRALVDHSSVEPALRLELKLFVLYLSVEQYPAPILHKSTQVMFKP
jgi:hypothetical protein